MFFKVFFRSAATASLSLALFTTIAIAQDHDHGYDRHDRDDDHSHAYEHEREHEHDWDHHYVEHDRDLHEWYRANHRHLPPGLARRDMLAPELQRQIVVHGYVPVEIRERMQPCPHEVEAFLPPPPPGHVHVFIGGNLVLVNRANFQIVDVFHFNLN